MSTKKTKLPGHVSVLPRVVIVPKGKVARFTIRCGARNCDYFYELDDAIKQADRLTKWASRKAEVLDMATWKVVYDTTNGHANGAETEATGKVRDTILRKRQKRVKASVEEVEFKVPVKESAGLDGGQWIWEVSSWRGVKAASLSSLPSSVLSVSATPAALKRVRAFCKARGYGEVQGPPSGAEGKALQFLAKEKEPSAASQVGRAVTGGIKDNGHPMRAQGLGFVGAKMISQLRKKGWAQPGPYSPDYYRYVITDAGRKAIKGAK